MTESETQGRKKATMTHSSPRRGRTLALAMALVTGSAFLAIHGSVGAIPPNAPKVGMVCTPGQPTALGEVTYDLVANTGSIQTPDGNHIFMWSYANADAPDNGAFQSPGPVLCVHQNDHVVVHLTNTLPEAASILFPGQVNVTASGGAAGDLTTEAPASGGTVTYAFDAGSPGTYLYQSGSDITKQVPMGLYGALIVRPTGHDDWAYGSGSTRFDPSREYLLLLAEIDPDLHHAVETGGVYDFTQLHNHYFTINGRSFPDTIQNNDSSLLPTQPYGALVRIQPNSPTNAQPALIRIINAGSLNHPFHPHGNHTRQIAQDGRPLLAPGGAPATTEHFGETVGAGQTQDFLLRWDDVDGWNPITNPFPVAQPNYRNVVFKDGLTWYSGNAYMGYKGTLPTGTTSQNVCGEWYFPLHSHALNEFTNFDEAMGGMGTLLRVDPPGGCSVFPASAKTLAGTLNSGTASNLGIDTHVDPVHTTGTGTLTQRRTVTDPRILATDVGSSVTGPGIQPNTTISSVTPGVSFLMSLPATATGDVSATIGPRYYRVNSTTTGTRTTDWYAQLAGVPAGSTNLRVTYDGRNCGTGAGCPAIAAPNPGTTVSIWNWTTSSWVSLAGPTQVGTTDVTVANDVLAPAAPVPGSWSSYIGKGANKGQVRVRVLTTRTGTVNFVTGGDVVQLRYDAP